MTDRTTLTLKTSWPSALMLGVLVAYVFGLVPTWLYWSAFGLYCARLAWVYWLRDAVAARRNGRSWRVADTRRPMFDGDEDGV